MFLSRAKQYLKGYGLVLFLVFVFSAVGYIHVNDELWWARWVVPIVASLIIWTLMYFAGLLVWVALIGLWESPIWPAVLLGFVFVGWLSLKLVVFLLPSGWITFSMNTLDQGIMGFTFAASSMVINDDILQMVAVAFSGPEQH